MCCSLIQSLGSCHHTALKLHFVSLYNQSIKVNSLMKQKFDNHWKSHQEQQNHLNKQAARWIFKGQ
ncbi:hypothetical protein VP01_196g13 [Puccinia sorghi]|uniref:Uncharacterized protein n=1 Tax=Puccinia sorghi TaxID=27349 RepID=A0A0L6VC08_9BASI|nr:hypothetical protein VP01_196g13 [Puccinia sorghi]